jgi:hypothetical protein
MLMANPWSHHRGKQHRRTRQRFPSCGSPLQPDIQEQSDPFRVIGRSWPIGADRGFASYIRDVNLTVTISTCQTQGTDRPLRRHHAKCVLGRQLESDG